MKNVDNLNIRASMGRITFSVPFVCNIYHKPKPTSFRYLIVLGLPSRSVCCSIKRQPLYPVALV